MTYETFEKIITDLEQLSARNSAAYKLGIDMINYTDDYFGVINPLMKEAFGEEGESRISWYLYEKQGRKDFQATDKDGNEICFDVSELYALVNG